MTRRYAMYVCGFNFGSCPMDCGRNTDDYAKGPCSDCWEEQPDVIAALIQAAIDEPDSGESLKLVINPG